MTNGCRSTGRDVSGGLGNQPVAGAACICSVKDPRIPFSGSVLSPLRPCSAAPAICATANREQRDGRRARGGREEGNQGGGRKVGSAEKERGLLGHVMLKMSKRSGGAKRARNIRSVCRNCFREEHSIKMTVFSK